MEEKNAKSTSIQAFLKKIEKDRLEEEKIDTVYKIFVLFTIFIWVLFHLMASIIINKAKVKIIFSFLIIIPGALLVKQFLKLLKLNLKLQKLKDR